MEYGQLASEESVGKTVRALKENGINAMVVENGAEAKKKVLEILPAGAQVMDMTSVTLSTISVADEITKSGKYNSVRNKLNSMSRETQNQEMQMLGAAPDWVIGSVHAVTEDGQVFIASKTGSQLPAYAYGANHVIWVVGTQKIVKGRDEAFNRIYEYALARENERAMKAYSVGSSVNKILIISKEDKPNRVTLLFVREVLGF